MAATFQAILNVDDAQRVLEASQDGIVVVYKHSPTCERSAVALEEMGRFLDSPEVAGVPVYMVDVIGARPASQWIEATTGVRHESPQALVLRSGRAIWNASHWGVTADALTAALAASKAS